MKSLRKLALDILLGAVIPILILNNLTPVLGAIPTYVVAVLIPVTYVLVDTFLITRRFNFIATYAAVTALLNGILTFWFVDGWRYALKDSVGAFVNLVWFGASMVLKKPILRFFMVQVLNPDTPTRRAAITQLLAQPTVYRSLVTGTWIMTIDSALTTLLNFWLDVTRVVAPFGTEIFNQQVAQVSIITRGGFPILSLIGYSIGIALVFKAIYACFPKEEVSAGGMDMMRLAESWYNRNLNPIDSRAGETGENKHD